MLLRVLESFSKAQNPGNTLSATHAMRITLTDHSFFTDKGLFNTKKSTPPRPMLSICVN